ncbi:hypothetical protein FRB99_003119, partial [Tulasnella sp. 403]
MSDSPTGVVSAESKYIEIPRQFGEADGFWKHYNQLADRYGKGMVKVLSNNLDSLLIFAGLFSAVNTPLIVYTLDMLSPPNNAQSATLLKLIALGKTSLTQADLEPLPFTPTGVAVRVNCLFGASLACSYLAAFGAVLAKQSMAPAQAQQGGQMALPLLLQLPLVTSVAGIIDFLHSINLVTIVISALCAIANVLYFVFVAVTTLDPECPFQTPISLFLRDVYIRFSNWAPHTWHRLRLRFKRQPHEKATRSHIAPALIVGETTKHAVLRAFQSTKLHAQSNYSSFHGLEATELYTELLRAFRTLVDTGAYHHEALTAHTLELGAGLRQLRSAISAESKGSQCERDAHGEGLELAISVNCLRRDDHLRKFCYTAQGKDEQVAETCLSRVKTLRDGHEGMRYAVPAWFNSDSEGEPDYYASFSQAGLNPTLQSCAAHEGNLPPISGIIVQLLDPTAKSRVEEVATSGLLAAFLELAGRFLAANRPCRLPYRMFGYIFDVWSWHEPKIMEPLGEYVQRLGHSDTRSVAPYVPDSFTGYIMAMDDRTTSGPSTTELQDAYRRLEKEAKEWWWEPILPSMDPTPSLVACGTCTPSTSPLGQYWGQQHRSNPGALGAVPLPISRSEREPKPTRQPEINKVTFHPSTSRRGQNEPKYLRRLIAVLQTHGGTRGKRMLRQQTSLVKIDAGRPGAIFGDSGENEHDRTATFLQAQASKSVIYTFWDEMQVSPLPTAHNNRANTGYTAVSPPLSTMDEPPSVPFSPRRPYFQHRATVSESGGKFAPTLTATPEPISPSAGSATLDGYPFASQPKPGANARSSIASSRSGSFDGLQIEIPRQFGEAGGYWNHYDHLADRHDRDMVRVLSDNLDSLLIFAGLFSSVNTALIVFTFDMLSPPNDAQTVALLKLIALGRTNLTANDFEPPPFTPTSVAVRVNCFFGASLACSLLASFGAVLAKQWVSHFARDHPGTLETQGRWRQRKLNGVARWHFQNVVETLPILLQIALVTFIAGVIDFLNSLNRVVTAIVTLFCAAGIVAYGVSVIVATLDPECPFQTPVSLFLHEAYIRCWDWGSDKWDRLRATLRRKRGVEPSGFGLANIMPTAIPLALGVAARDTLVRITTHTATTDVSEEQNEKREDREDPADEKVDDEIDNHTASWVVETSEHKEALLVTAKNIPALRTIKGTRLGQGGMAYVRLGSLFKEALTTWKTSAGHGWTTAQTVSALEGALIYGRALAHCSIGGPSVTSRPHTVSPPRIIWPKWRKSTINNDANELLLLRSCLVEEVPRDFCINHARDSFPQFSAALPIYLAGLMKPSTEKKRFRISASKLDRITLVQWLAHMSFANPDISSPTILNIGAWSLGKLPSMISGTDDSFTRELQDEWWHAYTSDKNLYKNVVQALNMYHYYQRLQ